MAGPASLCARLIANAIYESQGSRWWNADRWLRQYELSQPNHLARALEIYSNHVDKEWGLIDCVSFVVMKDEGLTEALTAD